MNQNNKTTTSEENKLTEDIINKSMLSLEGIIKGIDFNKQINIDNIPDKVKYSKVEEYFRKNHETSSDIEITRRIFTHYIQNGILPKIDVENRLNDNFTLYTRDQIIYYIMAQQLKSLTKLDNISKLFNQIRENNNKRMPFDTNDVFEFYSNITSYMPTMFQEILYRFLNDYFKEVFLDGISLNSDETIAFDKQMRAISSLLLLVFSKSAIDYFDEVMKNEI